MALQWGDWWDLSSECWWVVLWDQGMVHRLVQMKADLSENLSAWKKGN